MITLSQNVKRSISSILESLFGSMVLLSILFITRDYWIPPILEEYEFAPRRQSLKSPMSVNASTIDSIKRISPSTGDRASSKYVIIFSDYNCSVCAIAEQDFQSRLKRQKFTLYVAQYPILGPNSVAMAEIAIKAHFAGKYEQVRKAFAVERGKDYRQNQKPVNSVERKVQDKVDYSLNKIKEIAHELNIEGTPAIIVNGKIFYGWGSKELKAHLDKL